MISFRPRSASGPARNPVHPHWVLLALLLLGMLPPLAACWGPEYESVHFNDARPDFLQMPPPWWRFPGDVRAIAKEGRVDRQAEVEAEGSDRVVGADVNPESGGAPGRAPLSRQATAAEQRGDFSRAAALWERYRQALQAPDFDRFSDSGNGPGAEGLADRIEALRVWRAAGDTAPLRGYLQARTLVNGKKYDEAQRLLPALAGTRLAPLADYLAAAIRYYRLGTAARSETVFAELVRHRPGLSLAHYMLGRTRLAPYLEEPEAPAPQPDAVQLRRSVLAAASAYEACYRAAPSGPLAADALGMQGACYYRLKDYAAALPFYCRQLALLPPGRQDSNAFVSARWCLRRMDAEAHRRFQEATLARPEIAAVYLDLILQYHSLTAQSTHNLGLFALKVLERRPNAPLSARLLSRLALVETRTAHPDHAERLARRALAVSPPPAERDEARWQLALALRALHREREALKEYERLASTAALGKLRRGAHEAAAVLSEVLNDYPSAIRHYFALDYKIDYAYVIDCLASEQDLREFVKRYPSDPHCRLVRYSLGYRQLRGGRYDDAIRTFESLGPWLETAERMHATLTSRGKPRSTTLKTALYLRDAAAKAGKARTDAERATAEYDAAAFIFHQRHLVFYNGALWQGRRTWALELHDPHNVPRPSQPLDAGERSKLDRYQDEHTALAQALHRFEQIANRYPKSAEAPKALYSAALCYTLLPSVDRYWGERASGAAEKAISLYHRIQRDYPTSPVAAEALRFGGPLPVRKGAGR